MRSGRITMSDIARETGVSKNTVSLALRNDPQIPQKTRQRIQAIADKLGYQRHPVVSHLMAQLRARGEAPVRATLALLNGNEDPQAFEQHPTIPAYVKGCQRRAKNLGYSLDTFWLHDPELNGQRLNRMLKSRGIRGVVVVGLMKTNRLPLDFSETWEQYPCVVTGVRTRKPALSFASTDHHVVALRAFQKAIELGYKRPGLVLDQIIENLVEGRFTAGYQIGQNALPRNRRLHPFYQVQEARDNLKVFQKWFEKEQPDVILTLYNSVRHWLEAMGKRVPQDVGLIQLEWRDTRPEWAGMHQHNEQVGEAAIDMLVSMIHNGEYGIPPFPRATLIGGTWVDGVTVREN